MRLVYRIKTKSCEDPIGPKASPLSFALPYLRFQIVGTDRPNRDIGQNQTAESNRPVDCRLDGMSGQLPDAQCATRFLEE